jgi:hypothetical protein
MDLVNFRESFAILMIGRRFVNIRNAIVAVGVDTFGNEQRMSISLSWRIKVVKCPTCDGSGEVHSHNPKCWDCDGKGRVSEKKAAELIAEDKRKNPQWYPSK